MGVRGCGMAAVAAGLAVLAGGCSASAASPGAAPPGGAGAAGSGTMIAAVGAENEYADVISQVGGPYVRVRSTQHL